MELRARGLLRGATYRLRLDLPDGTSRVVPVRGGAQRIALPLAMRDVRGDIALTNLGPAARQIGPTDNRAVSLQVSEPELTRVGP
jgi:hypothetical protein